jgi:hypothetical protein
MSINYHPQAYESLQARSAELLAEADLERALLAAQPERTPFLVWVAALFTRLAVRAVAAPALRRSEEQPEAEPASARL